MTSMVMASTPELSNSSHDKLKRKKQGAHSYLSMATFNWIYTYVKSTKPCFSDNGDNSQLWHLLLLPELTSLDGESPLKSMEDFLKTHGEILQVFVFYYYKISH